MNVTNARNSLFMDKSRYKIQLEKVLLLVILNQQKIFKKKQTNKAKKKAPIFSLELFD